MAPLRFGLLGAARITPKALIDPIAGRDDAVAQVIGARDRGRAEAFAARHGVPIVVDDYRAVVEHPEVDAVYNALPPSEHLEWTIAALAAGKHVLCEKPIAANAEQAREMAAAAHAHDRVLCEAFHWRYHPLAERMLDLVRSDRLGEIRHVEAVFTTPIPDRTDIRHRFELAGGSLMDLGCYPVQWCRALVPGEPRVVSAAAVEGAPHIDARLTAELEFPNGVTATIVTGMEDVEPDSHLVVHGTRGTLRVTNPLAPQFGHELAVDDEPGFTVEGDTSYAHQLDAFLHAVRSGWPLPTDGADAVANMEVIDAVYRAAGLPVRGTDPDAAGS